MSLSFPIGLVHAGPGAGAIVVIPDASLHAAALSAVYGLYCAVEPSLPVSGMTAEPAPQICETSRLIPRRLLDRAGRWREAPAVAVEQIVDARCIHIVFEPLMPPAFLRDLVERATNAANRIVVFCTLEDFQTSDLGRMQDVQVFALAVRHEEGSFQV